MAVYRVAITNPNSLSLSPALKALYGLVNVTLTVTLGLPGALAVAVNR
jgi:hypothetical protein